MQSQDLADDYVAPSEAVPRGKAPRMQVQLLNPGEPTKQYAVIFYQGDEAFSGLAEFAEKYHVTSATQNVQEDPHQWPARSDWDER